MIDQRPISCPTTSRRRLTRALACLVASGFLFLLLTAMVDAGAGVIAQEMVQSEARLKSAFIFNFAKFVEWPANAFADANSPMVVGIVGKDTLGSALDQVIQGKSLNGRPMIVHRFAVGQEVQPCHILFVSAKNEANLAQILQRARGASVLTVGETEGFLKAGGIIRFVTVDNRLQFEISSSNAAQSGLKISSKLLQLSRKPNE